MRDGGNNLINSILIFKNNKNLKNFKSPAPCFKVRQLWGTTYTPEPPGPTPSKAVSWDHCLFHSFLFHPLPLAPGQVISEEHSLISHVYPNLCLRDPNLRQMTYFKNVLSQKEKQACQYQPHKPSCSPTVQSPTGDGCLAATSSCLSIRSFSEAP